MSKLAFDPKPAPSIFPVCHTHPFASYLGGFGLHCEGDMFLQGAELLVGLSLERVGEHTATRAGVQRRRRELIGGDGVQGRSRQAGMAGWRRCRFLGVW